MTNSVDEVKAEKIVCPPPLSRREILLTNRRHMEMCENYSRRPEPSLIREHDENVFWHWNLRRDSYLVFAVQHDVHNVTLFVAPHLAHFLNFSPKIPSAAKPPESFTKSLRFAFLLLFHESHSICLWKKSFCLSHLLHLKPALPSRVRTHKTQSSQQRLP